MGLISNGASTLKDWSLMKTTWPTSFHAAHTPPSNITFELYEVMSQNTRSASKILCQICCCIAPDEVTQSNLSMCGRRPGSAIWLTASDTVSWITAATSSNCS